MDKEALETLELVVKQLSRELEEKKEWGHFGNSFGRSESKKILEFNAEILIAIAENI